jgi:hypothetical protein
VLLVEGVAVSDAALLWRSEWARDLGARGAHLVLVATTSVAERDLHVYVLDSHGVVAAAT